MPIDAHPFMVEFTLVSLPSAQRFPRIKYQTIDHNDGAATTFLTGHLLHTSLHGIFLRENFLSPSFVHRFLLCYAKLDSDKVYITNKVILMKFTKFYKLL